MCRCIKVCERVFSFHVLKFACARKVLCVYACAYDSSCVCLLCVRESVCACVYVCEQRMSGEARPLFHFSRPCLLGFELCRVGQNHVYTVYIRCFRLRNHNIYGHIRCIHTVMANPTSMPYFYHYYQ